MFYQKYPPNNKFADIVECYFIWEGYSRDPITVESPPNAYASIVFNYRRPYSVSTIKYEERLAPQEFICGQAIRNYTLHLHGDIGMIGIVFKPTGIYEILGVPMYEFTGERIPLGKYVGQEYRTSMKELNHKKLNVDKVKLLEDFLERLTPAKRYGCEQIRMAANEILESYGNINVQDLLNRIYLSRRQFERKFLEEVGVSPKAYAKIRRFGYSCSLMAGKSNINLADVFYTTGYYDQSHFIRDFKYFSGRTPNFYLRNNVELANFVKESFGPR